MPSNEIIYEDDKVIVYAEYDPASHIYDNDEINLNVVNKMDVADDVAFEEYIKYLNEILNNSLEEK